MPHGGLLNSDFGGMGEPGRAATPLDGRRINRSSQKKWRDIIRCKLEPRNRSAMRRNAEIIQNGRSDRLKLIIDISVDRFCLLAY